MSGDNVAGEKRLHPMRDKIIYGLSGFLVMLAALPILLCPTQRRDLQAELLFLGDSIVGQCRDETGIPVLTAIELGSSVINGAFGGSTMSLRNLDGRDAYYHDSLSFSRLARAVATEDFGSQQTIRTKNYVTMHFKNVIDQLDIVDFSTIKVVFISYGMNDYTTGSAVVNPLDPRDPYTVEGAMRTGIYFLQKAYPDLRIIFVSPTYCWFLNAGEEAAETCETNDYGGGYLEEYVEAMRCVADECGVEFLDLYHDYYPHEQYQDWQLYTEDGIHPNEAGRQKIAQTLAAYLRDNE